VVIVDETYHFKSSDSYLHELSSEFRILLSRTPLETNFDELQSVLEFLHPGKFTDVDVSDLEALKTELQPHIFHSITNTPISGNNETVIECPMTSPQPQLYRSILERNASSLHQGTNLVNIAMELQKVCPVRS
jgi:SNF2 family DNA or RNA helicase